LMVALAYVTFFLLGTFDAFTEQLTYHFHECLKYDINIQTCLESKFNLVSNSFNLIHFPYLINTAPYALHTPPLSHASYPPYLE